MRIDPARSNYQEIKAVREQFNRAELRHLRTLLRRLRFLEAQVRDSDDPMHESVLYAEREEEALAWMLDDIGFLDRTKQSSTQSSTA